MDKSDDFITGEVIGVRQYDGCILLFVDEGDGNLVPMPFEPAHWQSAFDGNPPESHSLVGRRIRYDGDSLVYLDGGNSVGENDVPGRKSMSDLFDHLDRANFDKLFSLDEEGRQAKAKLLREAGVPEELIADFCSPGIKPGMTLGGAKAVDVMTLVERVLFQQNAGSVLLRVSRPPFDEAGHIEISVLEVGPPAEQGIEGEQASQEEKSP